MTTLFQALYSNCQTGWLSTWNIQDKKTRWYPAGEWSRAQNEALELAKAGKDLYFGVGLRTDNLGPWKRGANDTVISIPALWVDIDIAGTSHKKTSLPPSLDEAIKLIKQFPLKPSALVHSGYGLHGYWIIKEPWDITGSLERKEAQDLLKALEQTIRHYAQAKGWDIDPVADLARVLRVPGTFNYKQHQRKGVTLMELNENRYNPGEFSQYLVHLPKNSGDNQLVLDAPPPLDTDFQYGPASYILANCSFIQYCQEKAQTLAEPLWYALVSNLARGQGGRELVHGLSAPYPGYSWQETERKINQALEKGYPHTCQYIKDQLGFNCSQSCPVTAPVGHCMSKITAARTKLTNLSKEQVFTPEIVGALAVLKKDDPISYGQVKQELRGKVNLNDLEKAIKHQLSNRQKLRVVKEEDAPVLLKDIMEGIPLEELVLPPNWTINEQGVWQPKKNREGKIEALCACPVPVILTKRMQDIDTGEEKLELAYYRDKCWQYLIAKRSTVFSRQGLLSLADKGLPVSSESSKYLVKYLDDLERANLNVLPLNKSIGRMGWINDQGFLPAWGQGIQLDVPEGSGEAILASGYQEWGSLEEWVKEMEPLLEHKIARFFLAASFAAPLLRVLNQRVFFIHSWGPSRGGKTAVLKAALSVWGEPEVIMANFNSTKVGLERLAAFYCDLPLGIDERQVVGDKQGLIESLVYMLGMGKGKTRGAKGGGTQRTNFWRTIALTTGEEPLSSDSSNTGIKTRVLELYGVPLPDEKLARRIHEVSKLNYGTAGAHFIKNLMAQLATNGQKIQENYQRTKEALTQYFGNNVSSHIDLVTTVAVADYYVSQWIFQKDQEQAGREGAELAQTILGYLDNATETDESQRAYEFLLSWYYVHQAYFKGGAREEYGKVDQGVLYIYPTVFDGAMVQGGFNANRILRDWAEQGLIEIEIRGNEGKRRFKVRKWEPETQTMKTYVALKLKNKGTVD